MRRSRAVRSFRIFVVIALGLLPFTTNASGPVGGNDADVGIGVGVISDPGSPDRLSYSVTNAGPAAAHHVVLQVPIPAPATLRDVVVGQPCQITTPGTDHSGQVALVFDGLDAGGQLPVDVFLYLPEQAGPIGEVSATVSADEVDPDTANNVLTQLLSVPRKPTIERIRVLANPFRLEITGTGLTFGPFGSVFVGCDAGYRAQIESEEPDGTRVVIGRGRALAKQFPVGYAVRLTVVTSEGGRLETTYSRRR